MAKRTFVVKHNLVLVIVQHQKQSTLHEMIFAMTNLNRQYALDNAGQG